MDSSANSPRRHDDDVFCMLPWVSIHVATTGDAYPCCAAALKLPVGSVRTQALGEIWNSASMRDLRRNMLEGRKSPLCAKCYEQEASGFASLRTVANAEFAHHGRVVQQTTDDGAVEPPNLVYLDVRFSNVCNFACRTCGPEASTAWGKYARLAEGPLIRPRRSPRSLLDEIEPMLGQIEHAYFAGGEPLLMQEHYTLLEMLLDRGRDDVHLSYSSNYSIFEFGRWDILKLWKSFKRVSVGASLDGSHERGEYLRKGQRWSQVVENRRRQIEECPHVSFSISSTLSLLNSLHLPDFHEEWVNLGLVEPGRIHINILHDPSHFRVTTLPADLKRKVQERYERHLESLADQPNCESAMRGYESAIRFMYSQDTSNQLDDFREAVKGQDQARHESFESTFPELKDLVAVV
jgi:radical SAM protein with 4Fe4S-binding SPASM domain